MAKQVRVGVKAAWIGGSCLILATIITAIIANSKKGRNNSSIQSVDDQKVDTGSIHNYNAGRDVKIENNNYNGILQNADSIKKSDTVAKRISNQKTNIHEQTNVNSHNQSGGQTAKEIINNNN